MAYDDNRPDVARALVPGTDVPAPAGSPAPTCLNLLDPLVKCWNPPADGDNLCGWCRMIESFGPGGSWQHDDNRAAFRSAYAVVAEGLNRRTAQHVLMNVVEAVRRDVLGITGTDTGGRS